MLLLSLTTAQAQQVKVWNKRIKKGYPEVKSFAEINGKAGVYCTKNRILNNTVGNRGTEEGFVEAKVLHFNKLKDKGTYLKDLEVIFVNSNGDVLEANNRLESAMRRGEYVKFCVVEGHSEKLQSTDANVRLNETSSFNDMTSRWTGNENFKSAIATDIPLAILINQYLTSEKNQYKTAKGGKIFTYTKLFHVLDLFRDYKGLNGIVTRSDLDKNSSELYEFACNKVNAEIYDKIFELANLLRVHGAIRRPEKVLRNLFMYMERDTKDKLSMLTLMVNNAQKAVEMGIKKHGIMFFADDTKKSFDDTAEWLYNFSNNAKLKK